MMNCRISSPDDECVCVWSIPHSMWCYCAVLKSVEKANALGKVMKFDSLEKMMTTGMHVGVSKDHEWR